VNPEVLIDPTRVDALQEKEAASLAPLPSRVSGTNRNRALRRLLVVADFTALALAFVAAELAGLLGGSGDRFFVKDLLLLAAAVPTWALIVHAHGLYHVGRRAEYGLADELGPILHVVTIWTWGAVVLATLTGIVDVTIAQAAVFWLVALSAMVACRAAVRARARRQLWYLQNTLVVGSGPQIATMVAKIRRHPEYGVNLVACVDYSDEDSISFLSGSVPVLRDEPDLLALIDEYDVERVVIAWNAQHAEERLDLIHDLSQLHVQVDLVPSWFELLGLKLDLQEMEGTPLLTVPYTRLTRSALVLKRGLDIAVSSLALLVTAPLFLTIAATIKMTSRGPVFFRQARVGRDDRPFMMLKFRSMHDDAEERKPEVADLNFHGGGLDGGMFKIKDDPRVTPVGRWLRRWSLDELPQLLNVLQGHMSLVGPRPLIESEARQVAGRFRRRLSLTPGLTGLWQIHGRSEIPFDQMVSLDYLYATSWSIWGDLQILIKTGSAVLARRGAY
jgi:exopolysaccharide biosynthesis polyprenyl glycosylphosphotransferase